MIEIPILDHTDQQFGITLSSRRLTFRVRYNQSTDRWALDLSVDDLPVLKGKRIVAGVDMLAAHDLGVGAVFAFSETGAAPNRDNLPAGLIKLYGATAAEIEEARA